MSRPSCLHCVHFYMHGGAPLWGATIKCLKDRWRMKNYDTTETFRDKLAQADSCPDWESASKIRMEENR